jgi:hypothetical protein
MSGMNEPVELKSHLGDGSLVFAVRLTGSSTVTVKEFREATDAETHHVAAQPYYAVEVLEVLHRGRPSTDGEEPWTLLFTPGEEAVLGKARTRGAENAEVGDTIFIMNGEDLDRTHIYYVEGRHKIFYYYFCPDAAKSVGVGKTLLFISGNSVSRKNGVLYGNVGDGLYPDTKAMRKKIAGILAGDDQLPLAGSELPPAKGPGG